MSLSKKISFLSLILFLMFLFSQCSAPTRFKNDSASSELSGKLYKPEGDGPFAAVILMHGCGGDHEIYHQWARFLQQAGYAAFVLDSFTPRGVAGVCGQQNASPTFKERVSDAFSAKTYLSSLAFIDPEKIALIGWSHGGVSALLASLKKDGETEAEKKPFAAVIAFYPYCFELSGNESLSSPLLILIGTADDWTPSRLCEVYTQKMKDKNQDISLILYPEATHAFDFGINMIVQGHHLNYSRTAKEDAELKVAAFLAEKLK